MRELVTGRQKDRQIEGQTDRMAELVAEDPLSGRAGPKQGGVLKHGPPVPGMKTSELEVDPPRRLEETRDRWKKRN